MSRSLCAAPRTVRTLVRIAPDEVFPARDYDKAELTMNSDIERNLGEQPVARIMREHNLNPHDLVAISSVEMTHKMVSRACKGRWLTPNVRGKLLRALNKAAGKTYTLEDLFTYP